MNNIFLAPNQHIRLISEGSHDTESGVKAVKHLHEYIDIEIYLNRKIILNCNYISQYYCIFDQIDVA